MSEPTIRAAHIFISDLRLQARVGVNPDEQGIQQPISVDVQMGSDDLARSVTSERLEDTTDYVEIADTVRAVVSERHYPLVEGLADTMARAVLKLRGAAWVRVRVHKLTCLEDAAGAGVEVEVRHGGSSPIPEAPGSSRGMEDVVIIGGGAAGMAAALWCWRLGHPALLVDPGPRLGGQLHQVHGLMPDLPALPPMNGDTLARRLGKQFQGHRGRWLQGRVVGLREALDGWSLTVSREPEHEPEHELTARGVVLAMGIRRRALGVPGEREFRGRGILATAARDPGAEAGRQVVVVGGGDAACENALILARASARVTLLNRGEQLTCRREFVQALKREERIVVRSSCDVLCFRGTTRLEGVEILTPDGVELLPARSALVRVGWIPNSAMLPPQWLDEGGFIRTDTSTRVITAKRICAAGDVTGPVSSSVASAVGAGANAARAVVASLERLA